MPEFGPRLICGVSICAQAYRVALGRAVSRLAAGLSAFEVIHPTAASLNCSHAITQMVPHDQPRNEEDRQDIIIRYMER